MNKLLKTSLYILVSVLVGVTAVYATSKLTPPGTVTNTMYSLTDIFNLSTGTTTTEGTGTIGTTPGTLAETGKTLTEVYTAISTELVKLTNGKIAKNQTAFGFTGTLYGDTDPSKVLTTATYAGTATTGYILPSKPLQTTLGTSNYCTDTSGAVISCVGTGQDGEFNAGQPHSYTDNNDETVTDNATGLMWQKCTVGLSGTNCATGTATAMNWTTALSTCNALDFAGHTDWRLPNLFELYSLVNIQYANTAINRTIFPNTIMYTYWASSVVVNIPVNAWVVNFSYGWANNDIKTNVSYYTRCVRNLP